jgi:tetratricopeptide (TPR) repeat protein
MDLVRRFACWGLGLSLCSLGMMVPAADGVADQSTEIELPAAPNPDARFKLQIGDEEPIPADPKTPADSLHAERRKAITWQLTGQLHLSRSEGNPAELSKAEASFRKAIESDPKFLRSYQMLVSLLISGPISDAKIEEARKVTFQAAEQFPEGFTLVRQLANVLTRRKVEDGVAILNAALQIRTLPPNSVTYFQIQRDLGTLYRLSSKTPLAMEAYKIVFDAVTKTDPALLTEEQKKQVMVDPAALFEEMGEVFLAGKKPDWALAAFDRAAEVRGSRSAAHSYNLAQVFRDTGQPQQGLDELQKYLDSQLQSRGRGAYQLLKDLLTDLKRESELTERLEAMREKDRQNSPLRYFLAEQYVEQKRFEEAEKAILNGQDEVRDPIALVGLIPVYRSLKKWEKLLDLALKGKATLPDPDDPDRLSTLDAESRSLVLRWGRERDALAHDTVAMDGLVQLGLEWKKGDEPKLQFPQAWVLGELCGFAERADDANVFYRHAIDLQNDPPYQLFAELGQIYMDADRYEEAVKVFQEVANHPSSALQESRWRAMYSLSFALEFAGRTDEALSAATASRMLAEQADIEAAIPSLHAQIAWIHYHSQNLDEAIKVYEEVLKKYPKDSRIQESARFSLSAIYVLKLDYARGEALLQEVLQKDPDNSQANNDLGYLWSDQGKNLDEAHKMILKALEKEPDNAAYLDSLGWVLFKLGQIDEAVKKLEQACGMKRGDDPTLRDHLGDCYAKAGRTEDARKAWQEGLDLMAKKNSKDQKLRKTLREKLGLPAE